MSDSMTLLLTPQLFFHSCTDPVWMLWVFLSFIHFDYLHTGVEEAAGK